MNLDLTLPRLGARAALIACVLGLLGAFVAALAFLTPTDVGRQVSYNELVRLAGAGAVKQATFLDEDSRIVGTTGRGRSAEAFWVDYPASDTATAALLQRLVDGGAQVTVDGQPVKGAVRLVTTGLLPLLILAALFGLFFVGSRQGGEVRAFGTLGRRGAATAPPSVSFADVAGADEAVAELREVVSYLREPERYAAVGASAPKGVLLFGPPGTGKTLIARATAGEAGVPFFSVAGAEFVESLVGVGAARIRDLFSRVRAVAPAIVFIDEIDAAGRRRGAGDGGASEEREQTLNQLLVELDGFAKSAGIVVMGATNRPDILDPALLRPGRFDRHVTVAAPDPAGRRRILELHAAGKPMSADVDLGLLARRTSGFTGADLANVVNEAALLAVRDGRAQVEMRDLLEGVDRVLGGPRRRGTVLDPATRRRVACHEAGHAVVAAVQGADVHRVAVVVRGASLGAAAIEAGAGVRTREQLYEQLVLDLAGAAGETLMVGAHSTGVEDDLQRASRTALDIAARYGMCPAVGKVRLMGAATDEFLGGAADLGDLSEDLRRRVEEATRDLIEDAFGVATEVLERHRPVLDALVEHLVAEEVLEGPRLEALLAPVRNGALPQTAPAAQGGA